MANKNNPRFGRIDEEMKKEISHIISFELKDPNLTGLISVTKVEVTTDLKYAKVAVSILNANDTKGSFAALKRTAGFIRSEIAKRINLRSTPEILFELDDSMEYGARIDSILKDVLKEVKVENNQEDNKQ